MKQGNQKLIPPNFFLSLGQNGATLSGNIRKFLILLKRCPVWPPCRLTNSSRNLLLECLNMLKHFSATFVAHLYVVQFGHNVGQQFSSISHLRNINMRSVVLQTHMALIFQIKWPVKIRAFELIVQNEKNHG